MADMDDMRARSASPFTPSHSSHHSVHSMDSTASQETAYTSLIKYVPDQSLWGGDMEQLLFDFFVNGICPGRTPATQTNTYLSLLQTANMCESTKYALLSLSASYIREYLHSDKERFQQAELFYSAQAFQSLGQQIANGENYEGALSTAMLLMHHGAINDSESTFCWSVHANIFNIIPSEFINHTSDTALYMRTQLVLARTAQTSFTLHDAPMPEALEGSWLDGVSNGEAQKICSTLGMSPQLINIISSINSLAAENGPDKQKHMYAQMHETQLQNLRQWTPETQRDTHDILLATAEAFRLAAIIYLRCRLYG